MGKDKKAVKKPANQSPVIASLRGSAEFKAYLERGAQLDRCPVSLFLERAAIFYAKYLGLKDEPPTR